MYLRMPMLVYEYFKISGLFRHACPAYRDGRQSPKNLRRLHPAPDPRRSEQCTSKEAPCGAVHRGATPGYGQQGPLPPRDGVPHPPPSSSAWPPRPHFVIPLAALRPVQLHSARRPAGEGPNPPCPATTGSDLLPANSSPPPLCHHRSAHRSTSQPPQPGPHRPAAALCPSSAEHGRAAAHPLSCPSSSPRRRWDPTVPRTRRTQHAAPKPQPRHRPSPVVVRERPR